ncbi:hypothetical protein TEA_002194 [Camellia sinensis var. sinensis]|uniref:O-methyltransferase C-terminal domain-containing protein n=1 Tax=Camellia sinensis var. sinensis TaxID=542762 RepID=A0A4V3WMD6_CAMSN|nr:hypothetical protein TEA_002194 [Camellia sinensis var. sinensis]
MAMDLMMLTLVRGGKERTKLEWKKILNEGGFVRYNIIQIPALQSIIKAYPPKLATDVLQIQYDENCVKILRNCRKAIPEKTRKIIIVDTVLQPGGNGLFDNIGMAMDLVMLCLEVGMRGLSLNGKRY